MVYRKSLVLISAIILIASSTYIMSACADQVEQHPWKEGRVTESYLNGERTNASVFLTSEGYYFIDYSTVGEQFVIHLATKQIYFVERKIVLERGKHGSSPINLPLLVADPQSEPYAFAANFKWTSKDSTIMFEHNLLGGQRSKIVMDVLYYDE
ncbi:hypothetical protein C0431_10260 [bacterium]|nr:hypothetical protein [bacterium]